MPLATTGIYCTISPPLLGAMEDCSTVRVQQLQTLYRQRCCITHVRHVVEHSRRSRASATRRQSSAAYDGEMPESDVRWTSVANLKLTRGVPVTDSAPVYVDWTSSTSNGGGICRRQLSALLLGSLAASSAVTVAGVSPNETVVS